MPQVMDRPEKKIANNSMLDVLIEDFSKVYKIIKRDKDQISLTKIRHMYASREWEYLAEAIENIRSFNQLFKWVQIEKPKEDEPAFFNHRMVRRDPDLPNFETICEDLTKILEFLKEAKETGNYDKDKVGLVYDCQAFCQIQSIALTTSDHWDTDPSYTKRLEWSRLPESNEW